MIIRLILMFVLMTTGNFVYAAAFSIVPQGTLPTHVTPGGQVTAAYTVTNLSRSARNNNCVKHLPDNTYSSVSCGQGTFDLAPHGMPGDSYTLNLTVTGATSGNNVVVCWPGGQVCTWPYPNQGLKVSVSNRRQFAYIANSAPSGPNMNSVSICAMDANGEFNSCHAYPDASFDQPLDVILNSDATLAYVANGGSGRVSICSVNSGDGTLHSCELSDVVYSPYNGSNTATTGLQILNGYLYATDYTASAVHACPISGKSLLPCQTVNISGIPLQYPNSRVVFNQQGTIAYVSTYGVYTVSDTSISLCQVSSPIAWDCQPLNNGAVSSPIGIALNILTNYFYIANGQYSTAVTACQLVSGSLNCNSSTDGFVNLGGNQSNMFLSSQQKLYVPRPANAANGTEVSVCQLQSGALDLSACIPTTGDGTFNGPASVWIPFN